MPRWPLRVGLGRAFLLAVLILWLKAASARAENWPQWRGPSGTGISREREVPTFWGEDRAIAWKCSIPEWGNSTPIVWNDSVFLTSHTDDGRLLLLHIGARRGKILWSQQVGTGTAPREAPPRKSQKFHELHNLATPSPVTDGKTVVAHFGNGDLAAYDFNGGLLWKRNLQDDYGPYTIWWGHANSPVIYEGLVISICLQDSLADIQDQRVESYVVAHDLATGKTRWKTSRVTDARAEECDAYTTPILVNVGSQPQLIVMGGNQLDAYDPRTGRQLWYLPGLLGGRTVTNPTVSQGIVFATRGKRGPLFAVPIPAPGLSAQSDELSRRDILWSDEQGTPDACSPVAIGQLLFTVTDDGIARCFDVKTGKLKWKERLAGDYKASPVIVEGGVLFLNTLGTCTVVSASSRFAKLFDNHLDEQTIASPVVAHEHIYIRGRKTLYCVGRSFE